MKALTPFVGGFSRRCMFQDTAEPRVCRSIKRGEVSAETSSVSILGKVVAIVYRHRTELTISSGSNVTT